MARDPGELRRTMPALIASIPIVIVFFAVLGIILTAAGPRGLALSDEQTSGWIAVVYGLPMVPTLVLSIRYRQPLVLTGNIFAIIFFVSLSSG
jgi:benzoate membrane transport protein